MNGERVSAPFFIFIIMKELEDIFNTNEFKSLPFWNRVWIRIKVAFIQTISMR